MDLAELSRIEAELLLKAPGTLWEGLGLDGRPARGSSPVEFLTLREMAVIISRDDRLFKSFSASPELAARSVARTADFGESRIGLDPSFSHQRRCSTADESGLPEFARSGDPTPSPAFDSRFERCHDGH